MSPKRTPRRAFALLLLAPICACVTTDDARVQQLLNQRGFGARYTGDTNLQYYLGIGDTISIFDEQHPEFDENLSVRPDGVIDPKNIDEIFVAGLTIPDVQETLTRRYREFNTTAQIQAQLVRSASKFYYIDGEVQGGGRRPFEGDMTLFRVVSDANPSLLADEDNIELIRADPYHPLVVTFDYDDMLEGGWSRNNVEVRENDIVYVPPNVFGYLTIFTQKLFSPLQVIVASILDASQLINVTQTFGTTNRFGYGRGRNRFGGFVPYALPPSRERSVMQVAPVGDVLVGTAPQGEFD